MIKEYERELNELQEGKLISKEDLHEGDEIIYNGEHYFVTLTDTGTDFVWITDDESERYNRNAQGWTIKADWIDKVIGQPEEDELKESLKEDYKDFAFIVKCNDGPKELVKVVAEDKSKAEKYAKDMYAANHTIYADDRYNVWSIEDKNRSLKEDKVTGKPEDADEKIQFGDEIVYNGKHLFVINANFMDSDRYLWVTDKREDRYNRWAPGKLLAKDLVDKVIRQPDEDGQGDKMNKSIDFTDEAEIRKQLAKYSGQYLTITFKGSEDWKHISDLLDESINSDEEEEEELALDKLEASYRREYDLLKSLEVEEISEIVDYTSYVIVTIKVEKDNLLHNFSDNYLDFIHMPSIDTDTIKILELDKPTVQNQKIIKEDINMTRKEVIDWIEDHWNDTAEHGEWLYSYLTELGFNVEDDSDDEEGFYANLTTGDLRKIIDELKPNTKSAVKDQIADIREALKTLGRVSDVSLDYTGAEEATFDVNLKDGDTFRIQIYKM